MKVKILFLLLFWGLKLISQDLPAYVLYDKDGNVTNYTEMISAISNADIVFFGEYHNNPISHWLELNVTKSLFKIKGKNLILGAEMFEADNQLILDEYLNGFIAEKNYEDEMRLWNNYQTDYKPIVTFAKENKIPFIATNIPRRYANVVFTGGLKALDNLSEEAKKYIAPLPIKYDPELNCYKQMSMATHGMKMQNNDNLPMAQAIKDATMSYYILKNWSKGKLFLHFNGSYHSDNHEGICWYIKQSNQNIKILTITTVSQVDLSKLDNENNGLADFIICVPNDMTSTY